MTPTANVIDVDVNTFTTEVLERSKKTPVLVDLWATWCGPCRTLGPTLDKVVAGLNGRVVLAKVDIDKNPELADAFGVQSVPTVMLVKDGRVVDGFLGAQPESTIQQFLAKHLGAAVDPLAEALELEKKDAKLALEAVRKLATARPPHAAAKVQLARLLLATGAIEEGKKAYEALSETERDSEPGRAAKALLALADQKADLGPLQERVKAQPHDPAAHLALGRALLAAQRPEQGLEELMTAAKIDLRFNDSEPRKALLEAFDALGAATPLVNEYRRRLSVLLCS